MHDVTRTPEQAAQEHVWQYEHEVYEPEAEVSVKVAEGTQIVGPDGKLLSGGQTLKLPESRAGVHIAAGFAERVGKR